MVINLLLMYSLATSVIILMGGFDMKLMILSDAMSLLYQLVIMIFSSDLVSVTSR